MTRAWWSMRWKKKRIYIILPDCLSSQYLSPRWASTSGAWTSWLRRTSRCISPARPGRAGPRIKGTCQGRKEDWSWPPTHECSIYRQWHWFIIKQAPFKEDSQLLSFSLLSLPAEQCSDTLYLVRACMCSLSQLLRARALSIIWKVEVAWPMGSHFVEWWGSLLRRWVRRTSPHFVACHFTLRQTIRLTLSTPNLDTIISLDVLYVTRLNLPLCPINVLFCFLYEMPWLLPFP